MATTVARLWPEILSEEWLGTLIDSTEPPVLGPALAAALDRPWDRDRIAGRAAWFSWEAGAERVERALEELQVGGVA